MAARASRAQGQHNPRWCKFRGLIHMGSGPRKARHAAACVRDLRHKMFFESTARPRAKRLFPLEAPAEYQIDFVWSADSRADSKLYCIPADQVPFAELKPELTPVEVHDQVPDAVAGPLGFGASVPPNEQETFAPPIPDPGWKLAMPVLGSSMPPPAPGVATMMVLPWTLKPSEPVIGAGHAPLTNCVPVKVPT